MTGSMGQGATANTEGLLPRLRGIETVGIGIRKVGPWGESDLLMLVLDLLGLSVRLLLPLLASPQKSQGLV